MLFVVCVPDLMKDRSRQLFRGFLLGWRQENQRSPRNRMPASYLTASLRTSHPVVPSNCALLFLVWAPNVNFGRRDPYDQTQPQCFGSKQRMLEKSNDSFRRRSDYVVDDDDTVASMTKLGSVKSQITREKRRATLPVQISQNLLLVVPLGSAYVNTDLSKTNSVLLEFLALGLWNIVVENDQAAELRREVTSFTRPRRVSDRASRTAAGLRIFRYSFAISAGEYPSAANCSTSLTAIRVPLKINRPR